MRVCGKEIRVEGRLIRIARLEAEKYKFVDDPLPIIESLKKSEDRIDLFTFMPRVVDIGAVYSYPAEWDNLAVLAISTFDKWWTQQVDAKTRNMVRKSEKKGITIKEIPFEDTLVRGIWEIYNECPIRQGRPFSHYGKDIETVRREESTFLDSSLFLGAFLGERLIGFVKLTTDETQTQTGLMNIVSMIQHRDKAPTNALIAQAVRSCAKRGIRYLVYSNFSYTRKQRRDGISEFKENNGFQRFNLPRYYIPLTRVGGVAFRLGLHHKLAERLPEPLMSGLRELRTVWYNRKFEPSAEAS